MRDEVIVFAQEMEKQLAANDDEREGWKDALPKHLLERAHVKCADLDRAVAAYNVALVRRVPLNNLEGHKRAIMVLSADLGNYSMMVADVCGALAQRDPAEEPDSPALTDTDD